MLEFGYAVVFVSDMKRSIEFYRDVIGLPLRFESQEWTEFDTPGTTLALHYTDAPSTADEYKDENPAGQCHPSFSVDDIDAYHERMRSKCVTCLQPPKEEEYGRKLAKYVDPDGLPFTLSQPLKDIRPRFIPGFLGMSFENAAHRIAVEWDKGGRVQQGVYIPRRDTSSQLNTFAGGRIFPGVHHHAQFQVEEDADRYSVIMDSDDNDAHVAVVGDVASQLPFGSIFSSLDEVSDFFEQGSQGYSATPKAGSFDGLELRTFHWQVTPLRVENVESSFFENLEHFPAGSVEFDCALLMRGIEHEWHGREPLYLDGKVEPLHT